MNHDSPFKNGIFDQHLVSSIKAYQLCVKYKKEGFELCFALEKDGIW